MLQKFWYYALLAFLFCGTMAHSMMQEEDKEDVSRQPTEKKRKRKDPSLDKEKSVSISDRVKEKKESPLSKEEASMRLKPAILIVDDNELCRILLQRLLEEIPGLKDRYDVITANDGDEALLAINNRQFSLVCMDYRMQRMMGDEATEKIRTEHSKEVLPIFAISSDEEFARKKFFKAGIDRFFEKPLIGDIKRDLIKAVRETLLLV
ncbi:MAG: PAS/PAC sensor hybrid histidine kinase [uncultured bacterium]|nr:MAG: PAS/PAC sensor hybrid histidine kinase [uncultured bacterium]OFW70153.1 MAG: hypothetical protein A2X70_06740 [Alphaproteobacteria bacterium GWC2_42_16]OFW74620.1 MAG: hypothetical protein A2Z80_05625 [Alphaproteobacteria bacterium GWA2_41_27]OFW84663.1 MAG: hypothetical protein A3E50_02575 [Alphaproteobacteria bacterium RIFCSPHIGHO2_12_FULL_42_100]OFW85402.1 MAG: hypothetical protein A2W06_05040 [Alphaproteobacteria bacterium RBG_16_42_14]OFW91943.1 MAG: hypothetical protein A2W46_051